MTKSFPLSNIIAIIISCIALFFSCESDKTSKEALKHTKNAFIAKNRPYLTIDINRCDETDSFFKTVTKNDTIEVEIGVLLENKGCVPATNISFPDKCYAQSDYSPQNTFLILAVPESITLGPNESITCVTNIEFGGHTPDRTKDILKEIESGIFHVTLNMAWSYTSTLDNEIVYKSEKAYVVNNKRAIMIKSEMF